MMHFKDVRRIGQQEMPVPAAVCVAGLPNSGVTMVTRVLRENGLWLGPPETLIPPTEDDPDRGFESRPLADVDAQIMDLLAKVNGESPKRDSAYRDLPGGPLLEARAKSALGKIAGSATGRRWGWKHAGGRASLPFWCRLVTPLKAVVCVRNSRTSEQLSSEDRFAVASGTLHRRESYEQLLRSLVRPWEIIVTHYESWLVAPYRELDRIAEFLELDSTVNHAVVPFPMHALTRGDLPMPASKRRRAA